MQQPYEDRNDRRQQDVNPWATIWTSPRATVRWLAARKPWQGLWLLAIVGGTSRVFLRISGLPLKESLGIDVAASDLVLAAIIAGPLAGATLIFVFGWLLHMVLARMGGKATWRESRTAIAWALAPGVPSLLLWFVMLITQGADVVMSTPESRTFVVQLDYLLHFGFAVWSLVLEVLCLADVHAMKYWKVIAGELLLGVALMLIFALLLGGF